MTEQILPGGGSEQIVTPSGTTRHTPRRTRGMLLWGVALVVLAVVAAWILGGLNPSLASGGVSWQDPAFVEDPSEGGSDEKPTFVAWDLDTGAKASVVMRNDRPYPITVSPGPDTPGSHVEIAEYDPDGATASAQPDFLTTSPRLSVPAGGYLVVILQVTDRCMPMEAGTSIGNDSAIVKITTFGITSNFEVQFPATYMTGTTTGHGADPSCVTPE